MKTSLKRAIIVGAVMCLLVPAFGLAQVKVNMSLNFENYDVIFLSDFIDVSTRKLSPNIPNVYLEISTDPANTTITIYMKVRAYIQLKGKAQELLVDAETEPFTLTGSRTISSRDFAGGSTSDVKVKSGYYENKSLRTELEDYAKRFPTAPVGSYLVEMEAYSSSSNEQIGRIARTIEIKNASVSEVQVTLIEPQEGAVIPTLLPNFSWNSEKPDVTLYIYEKLPIHQSPQEAITGIPHLKVDLTGISTFVYPPEAPRRLEANKGYYWYVETSVSTNRGIEKRQSEIRFFRIRLENQWERALEQVFANMGGSAAGTFATLQNIGWLPSGQVTLDGRTLTREEFIALIGSLVQSSTPVTIKVE
jgi:hypothetical protein